MCKLVRSTDSPMVRRTPFGGGAAGGVFGLQILQPYDFAPVRP